MMRTYQTRQEFDEAITKIVNTFMCRLDDWDSAAQLIWTTIGLLKKESNAIQFGKPKISDLNVEQDGNVFYYVPWQGKRRASR